MKENKKTEEKSFKEFLESVPPGKETIIHDLTTTRSGSTYNASPKLQLYCRYEECQGVRFFVAIDDCYLSHDKNNNFFVFYECCNCRMGFKNFSLRAVYDREISRWKVYKYGEVPQFGPPTPARVIKLIGGERNLFLLGRRSEIQGMGIGAFVYYRRVLESQKNRIFDELIRVIKKISPGDAVIKELEAAKNESQFTRAIESIKQGLPQSLFINGHNPLTLLHSALSEGVHEHTDNECLELASSVRTVLFEFAERLGQALKEEAELKEAVNRLSRKKKGS